MDIDSNYEMVQMVQSYEEFLGYANIENYASYIGWRESVRAAQKSQSQTLSTTSHNNHSNHSNHNNHYDNSSHTDNSSHSNTSNHTNVTSHGNIAGHNNHTNHTQSSYAQSNGAHYNLGGSHTDIPHSQGYTHVNNATGHNNGHFNKAHINKNDHSNGYAHQDKTVTNHTNTGGTTPHSNTNPHNDKTVHSNANPHTNRTNHDNVTPHSNNTNLTNVGFDHSNYIPFKPDVNIEGEIVRDTYELAWHSYDKNQDGFGTQNTVSTSVKYYSKLRKVKNLDGSSSVSGWRQLANGTTAESMNLNTIDPLGVNNTDKKAYEGIYEIEIYSINDTISQNGVTKSYVSPTRTAYFTIRQNYDPKITITNASEFVNFNFGQSTKVGSNGNGNIVTYSSPEGLTVKFLLTDSDPGDYHKGQAYLSYGSSMLTSKYDISFSGSNSAKTGTVFIPKAEYLNDGVLQNVLVNIDVKDYTNSAMTVEAGGHLIQQRVSESGATMALSLDNNYPTVLIDTPSNLWTEAVDVNVDVSDTGLGIKERYYQVVNEFGTWDNSKWIPKSTNNFNVPLSTSGRYKIAVKAIDKAGNETIRMTSVFKVSPVKISIATTPSYPENIPASENLQVEVTTESSVDVNKVEIWLQNNEGNVVSLNTSDTGDKKNWAGSVLIPETYVDNDYTLFVKAFRYDGSYKTTTTPVKVETPINLTLINSPVFELDKEFSILARTSKYPTKTETKLFVGTSYETEWLDMYSSKESNHLRWIKNYIISNIPKSTYVVSVRSTLPNGKMEIKSTSMLYVEIDSFVKHTDEWERKRKVYNLAKSGNENSPRSKNIFFNGEKFVIESKVEIADPMLKVDHIDVEILDTDYKTTLVSVDGTNWTGSLWDSSMMYKWGMTSPDELTFRFTVYYNQIDFFNNVKTSVNDVKVIVNDSESYYELHRDN